MVNLHTVFVAAVQIRLEDMAVEQVYRAVAAAVVQVRREGMVVEQVYKAAAV